MERFCENSKRILAVNNFHKRYILDVPFGSKNVSEFPHPYKTFSKYLSKI